MTLAQSVLAVLQEDQATVVNARLRERWGGARIYVPIGLTRQWKICPGSNALQRFVRELTTEVQRVGGTSEDARSIMLAVTESYITL